MLNHPLKPEELQKIALLEKNPVRNDGISEDSERPVTASGVVRGCVLFSWFLVILTLCNAHVAAAVSVILWFVPRGA